MKTTPRSSSRRSHLVGARRFPRPLSGRGALVSEPEVRARGWMVALAVVLVGFLGLVTWELCRTSALVIPASVQEMGYAPACDNPVIQPFYGISAS